MIQEALSLFNPIMSVINILFAIVVVFYERRDPSVTWAWLMLVLILPYVGFIIYLLFGLESKRVRAFAMKARADEQLYSEYMESDISGVGNASVQFEATSKKTMLPLLGTTHFDDIIHLNLVSGNGSYTSNNSVDVFHDGNTKFDSLIADIRLAEKTIHLQYYIFRADKLGRMLIDELAKKAACGVEVRFMTDGMGSAAAPKAVYEPLIKAGGELALFAPPRLVRLNYRNHRKIAVIDGKIGYVGGLNIGDEYLGKNKKFGFWRDCHLRIDGEATKQLQLRFIMDWNYCSKRKLVPNSLYFPEIAAKCGDKAIQIVSSGPDTKWFSILYALNKMINEADHSIYIQTPYFVPDDSILGSLRIAALSGKDVRLMIPANPDHPFVYGAAMSYIGELIKSGVKCYQYTKGFVHSKLVVIDGLIASVGTANMDVRSFKLNFEITAFVYNEEIASMLERQFERDLADCTEITEQYYHGRPKTEKIKESVSRLMSPLL